LRRALVRSGKPRAVVRLTNKYVIVQVSEADIRGDIVRASASSRELAKLGWKGGAGNLPAAYLTGVLAARRAVDRGVKEAVLARGLKPEDLSGHFEQVRKSVLSTSLGAS